MSQIVEARDREDAKEFADAAELFLQAADGVLASVPRSEWSYDGVEAIGWALRAEFDAVRAGDDALAAASMHTALSAVLPFRADCRSELADADEPVDRRGLLAYLHEWEGDVHCYRDRPRAADAYRRARAEFDRVVEEGGDPPECVRSGWAAETGAHWAFDTFDEYLGRRGKSWPESRRAYEVAALDRLDAKVALIE